MPGDDYLAAFNIRGIGATRHVGQETDRDGNPVNVYEVIDKEFGDSTSSEQRKYEVQYVTWHRVNHQARKDQRCSICAAEQDFQKQRAPHEQFHRSAGKYDPTCRFCQDDRFLGRM